MPTSPTAIPAWPEAPSIDDVANFDTEADAWVGVMQDQTDALNALGTNVYDNAVEAVAGAATASTKAGDAAAFSSSASGSASAAAASALAAAGSASTSAGWSATSTTSMALTAGAKSLTIQPGKQFTAGTKILVKRTSDPDASQAFTSVTDYVSGTGVLEFTLAADDITGSGTFTDWTVELSGGRGRTGTGVVPQSVGFTLTGGTSSKTLTVDADATISDLMGGGDATNADVVALALEVAALKGSAMGLSSGVSDAFEDAAGVDAAGSTGETYDSTNDLYTNTVTAGGTAQPVQTGYTAPTGYVVTYSADGASNEAWRAFDQNAGSNWFASGLPAFVARQFPSSRTATAYTIDAPGNSNFSPTDWTFDGSNDGSTWTNLDTQTGMSITSTTPTYSIASPAPFTYYRLRVTGTGGGSALQIDELSCTFAASFNAAMSLRSVAYTALSAPAAAMITVAADLNGGAVNTDLIAYASRDNGTSWTAVTLTAGRTLADGTTIYSGTASIAAQPSGTNMKWRIDTSDDFAVDASAVVLQWS